MTNKEKEPAFSGANNQVGLAGQGCSSGKNPPEKKEPEKKKIKIRASMFFDGTKNNKRNISVRKRMEEDPAFKRELKEAVRKKFIELKKKEELYESTFPDHKKNSAFFSTADTSETISINETSDARIMAYMEEKHYLDVVHLKDELIKKRLQTRYGSSIESYQNDYTNVVKLENTLQLKAGDYDKHVKLYVEGQGTERYTTDSTLGYAFGCDDTGVVKKVEQGLESLLRRLGNELSSLIRDAGSDKENLIIEITLDAFGFSRGAAAARYFLYTAYMHPDKKIKARMTEQGYSINKVKVCFVGLFDTVSSYADNLPDGVDMGVKRYTDNGKPFSNNTEALHLDAVSYAERAVQLSSADEHRIFFALTNICSSPNGTEIFLPGVHSDIGGGYEDRKSQEGLVMLDLSKFVKIKTTWYGSPYPDPDSLAAVQKRLKEEEARLINEGWVYGHALRIEGYKLMADRKGNNEKGIRNTYSRIPLHVMIKYAGEHGLQFNDAVLKTTEDVPSELREIKNAIDNYIAKGVSDIDDWKMNTPGWLRRDYLHISASYDFDFFNTYAPYFENGPLAGYRKRIVFDG